MELEQPFQLGPWICVGQREADGVGGHRSVALFCSHDGGEKVVGTIAVCGVTPAAMLLLLEPKKKSAARLLLVCAEEA